MPSIFYSVVAALLLFLPFTPGNASTNSPERMVVHLLSYLSADYGVAVQDGQVISEFEYAEQKEFASLVLDKARSIQVEQAQLAPILVDGQRLYAMIEQKASPEAVSTLADELKARVLKLTGMSQSPRHWPSVNKGRQIFAQHCVQCHGEQGRGDGALGVDMGPAPANFWDDERMSGLSAFGAFNTTALGVEGTGMSPFTAVLSEEEMWDVSFYIMSMRHGPALEELADQAIQAARHLALTRVDLETLATNSDQQLGELFKDEENVPLFLATLRTFSGPTTPGGGGSNTDDGSLALARAKLEAALEAYTAGDNKRAHYLAVEAYLDGIEPIEPRLGNLDNRLLMQLEIQMGEVRTRLSRGASLEQVNDSVARAVQMMDKAEAQLARSSGHSSLATFLMAGGIVLREGLEAVLIVVTILGVVATYGSRAAVMSVHAGWILAFTLGVVSWFFSGMMLQGLQRELMESVAAFFAVAVLLYMGLWLHGRAEIEKWKHFVHERTKEALGQGKMLGLAAISFTACFREAFETVLFLRAIWIEGDSVNNWSLGGGVFAAGLGTVVLAVGALKLGRKLPLARLFSLSSALMLVLAVVLMGKGMRALQEIGAVSTTHFTDRGIALLGVYPTWETLVPQLLVLGLCMVIWLRGRRPLAVQS